MWVILCIEHIAAGYVAFGRIVLSILFTWFAQAGFCFFSRIILGWKLKWDRVTLRTVSVHRVYPRWLAFVLTRSCSLLVIREQLVMSAIVVWTGPCYVLISLLYVGLSLCVLDFGFWSCVVVIFSSMLLLFFEFSCDRNWNETVWLGSLGWFSVCFWWCIGVFLFIILFVFFLFSRNEKKTILPIVRWRHVV